MGSNNNLSGGMLYSSDDNGNTWKPVGRITNEPVSITCNISEEDAARLWAMCEGLEIVRREAE